MNLDDDVLIKFINVMFGSKRSKLFLHSTHTQTLSLTHTQRQVQVRWAIDRQPHQHSNNYVTHYYEERGLESILKNDGKE